MQDILFGLLVCQKPFVCSGQTQQALEQNLVLLPAKQWEEASTALLWEEELIKLLPPQMTFLLGSVYLALHAHVSIYIFGLEEALR